MTFWTYMIQCGDGHFYVGHTNDLEKRWAEHQAGIFCGYTSTRHPLHLVWSEVFGTRTEALDAEVRIKGWSRAKKLALIRRDWAAISKLAKSREKEGRASTSSAQTVFGKGTEPLFLHPHLAFRPSEPFGIEAQLRLSSERLRVRFQLAGPIPLLALQSSTASKRRNELWKHTCFEVFLSNDERYLEYNLSPSTEWAAYKFETYREGMGDLDVAALAIRLRVTEYRLHLTAGLALPSNFHPTRIGLSAVIEEKSGRKSYWALRHPPGDAPDFHHPDCFALEVPPLG